MDMAGDVVRYYNHITEDLADPRVKDYMFMSSPVYPLGIMVSYVYFVRVVGPKFMENRKPFRLDALMIIYNFLQIVVNIWFVERALTLGWWNDMKLICEPVDVSHSPKAITITRVTWAFFILKVSDMLDTVFIVMRKKTRQITFLHVYHHTGMVLATWIGTKYIPGGHGTLMGLVNSFVHAVMYTYYLLTCFNSEYKNSIWWKKYLTQLQMIQFLILFFHTAAIFFKEDCKFPVMPISLMLPQYIIMLFLFAKFYKDAYWEKKKTN